jgi:hypothetical protein
VAYRGTPGPIGPAACARTYRIVMSASVSDDASTMLRARFPETVVGGREIGLRCEPEDLPAALSVLDPRGISSLRREGEDVVADLFETLS